MTTHHFPVIRPHQKGFLVTCTCGYERWTVHRTSALKKANEHGRTAST